MFLAFKSFDKRRNNNGLIGGWAGRVLILHDISHHDRPDQVFQCTGAAINILHRPHLSGEECLTLNSYTTQHNYDTHLALMSSPQMWVCCLVSSGLISLSLHAQDVTGALDSLEWCPRTEVLRLTASPAPSCPHWESLYSPEVQQLCTGGREQLNICAHCTIRPPPLLWLRHLRHHIRQITIAEGN